MSKIILATIAAAFIAGLVWFLSELHLDAQCRVNVTLNESPNIALTADAIKGDMTPDQIGIFLGKSGGKK